MNNRTGGRLPGHGARPLRPHHDHLPVPRRGTAGRPGAGTALHLRHEPARPRHPGLLDASRASCATSCWPCRTATTCPPGSSSPACTCSAATATPCARSNGSACAACTSSPTRSRTSRFRRLQIPTSCCPAATGPVTGPAAAPDAPAGGPVGRTGRWDHRLGWVFPGGGRETHSTGAARQPTVGPGRRAGAARLPLPGGRRAEQDHSATVRRSPRGAGAAVNRGPPRDDEWVPRWRLTAHDRFLNRYSRQHHT